MDYVVIPIRLLQPQEDFLQMSGIEHVSFSVSHSKGYFLQVLPTGEFTIVSIIKNYLINIEETINTSQS